VPAGKCHTIAPVRRLPVIAALIALLAVAGCGGSDDSSSSSESSESTASKAADSTSAESSSSKKTKPEVTVPNGAPPKKLVIKEIEEGSGAEAKAGDEVTVQYVGVGYDSEEEFDSSWSRSEPFTFGLGAGLVIKGWDQGVEGMKVGGRRELIIPANLAYGATPPSSAIAPNEALIFVIDLLAVE
jgi:peptidylprolyl isomerase